MKNFGLCRQIIRPSFVNSKTVNDKCLKRNLDLHLKVVICNTTDNRNILLYFLSFLQLQLYIYGTGNCNRYKKWEMSNLKYKLFLIFLLK